MSGMEFKHPYKRGAHWEELETNMNDEEMTPKAKDKRTACDFCGYRVLQPCKNKTDRQNCENAP
jgi:hypothetical protein